MDGSPHLIQRGRLHAILTCPVQSSESLCQNSVGLNSWLKVYDWSRSSADNRLCIKENDYLSWMDYVYSLSFGMYISWKVYLLYSPMRKRRIRRKNIFQSFIQLIYFQKTMHGQAERKPFHLIQNFYKYKTRKRLAFHSSDVKYCRKFLKKRC